MKLPVLSCALAAGVFVFGGPECARALTLAEGLDTPGVLWTSTVRDTWIASPSPEAHDGLDLVEVPILTGAGDNEDHVPTLSANFAGPAVIRFWWRIAAADTDAGLWVALDGEFTPLFTGDNGFGRWMQVEVQLSAGAHTLGLRPLIGSHVQVDEMSITPGPGSLVQGLNVPGASWIIFHGGVWNLSTDAPPGWPSSVAWKSGNPYPEVKGLFPPHSKIEGWFKFTAQGYFSMYDGYMARRTEADHWQRFRTVMPGRWVTFVANNWDGEGHYLPVDLKLAGFTVQPAGVGDYLDAPELTWTASGAPAFGVNNDQPFPHATGSLAVAAYGPFDTGVGASISGPGRLYFSTGGQVSPEDRWDVTLNGATTAFHHAASNAWERHVINIPPGNVSTDIRAVNVIEDTPGALEWGSFMLDDVTLCVAAADAQKDALDLPASAEMWVRQSGAGLWSRDTQVSRDGQDSLLLAPSSGVRPADVMLPVPGGARLAGMWVKTGAATELVSSAFRDGGRSAARIFQPASSDDWTWMPVFTGAGTTELRLGVPDFSDTGAAVRLDNYAIYNTAVPVAGALDTPDRVWTGNFGLALPDSNAAGGKAVLLAGNADAVMTVIKAPARVKFRYRFIPTPEYSEAVIQFSDFPAFFNPSSDPPATPDEWQEKEVYFFEDYTAELRFRSSSGALLLDTVEFGEFTAVSIPEALDALDLTVADPNSWAGLAGGGHDGTDMVISAEMLRPPPNFSWTNSSLVMNLSGSGSVDGSFWWRREWDGAFLHLDGRSSSSQLGTLAYTGTGWQPVKMHYDRAPSHLRWTQAVSWYNTTRSSVPAGNVNLDELSVQAGEADTFSKALDTWQAPGQATTGWDAAGDATVAVQTAVTWQGGTALEIRATPGGRAVQSTGLFALFEAGTGFSCRVKRGAAEGATLTLKVENEQNPEWQDVTYAEIPLTAEWSEFRVFLPAGYATGPHWLEFYATVPNAGPQAVIYLDAVSVTEATDLNAALDTAGLTWTASGDGRQMIIGELIPEQPASPEFPRYSGFYDGVRFMDLTNGRRRRLRTEMNGPGTVVISGLQRGVTEQGWRAWLLVDNVVRDALPQLSRGLFQLQASVPPGAHSVLLLVERDPSSDPAAASLDVHSAGFVPGLPETFVPAAVEALTPGRTWTRGGSHPPVPLYALHEGVTSYGGFFFPAIAPGETSWMETTVSGPATMGFTWQSAAIAACRMDGYTACRTVAEPGSGFMADPRTTLEVPPGDHTLRWSSAQGATAELRAFGIFPGGGSDYAAVLGNPAPPVIWHFQPAENNARYWRRVPDDGFTAVLEDGSEVEAPGTGLPVLAATDATEGSFWVTGPALVSWDVRHRNNVALVVGVAGTWYLSGTPVRTWSDLEWKRDAVLVPAGEHLVTFAVTQAGFFYHDYVWIKDIRIEPGAVWLGWAYSIGLIDAQESSPYADPDNDGVINLMEFAFGTAPRTFGSGGGPVLTGSTGARVLQFPSLPWDAASLRYEVQTSGDLETWTTLTSVHPAAAGEPGPVVSLPAPEDGGRVFVRVRVGF